MQILHVPVLEFLGQVFELLGQRPPLRIEANKNMPVPGVDLHGVQWIVFTWQILHVWCANQLAIQCIGPSVVRALDAAGKSAFLRGADARAAMPAYVVKRPQRSVMIA